MKHKPLSDEIQESTIKSFWRDAVKNKLDSSFKKSNNKKCLLLPGSQAKELEQITDILNVKRHNIYGVEHDKKVCHNLKRKKLGINLYNDNLSTFLSQTDVSFDFISADLQNIFMNELDIDSLITPIYKRKLLNLNGFIYINKLNARDGAYKDEYIQIFDKHFKDKTFSDRTKMEMGYTYKLMYKFLSNGYNVKLLPLVKYHTGRSGMFTVGFQFIGYHVNGELKKISDTILDMYINNLNDLGTESQFQSLKDKGIHEAKDLKRVSKKLDIDNKTLERLALSSYNLNFNETHTNLNPIRQGNIKPFNIYNKLNRSLPNDFIPANKNIIQGTTLRVYNIKKYLKFLLIMATGIGKTRTIGKIIKKYFAPKKLKILLVTYRNHISNQFLNELQEHLELPVEKINGHCTEKTKIIVSTIHKLNRLSPRVLKKYKFDVVVIDEAHHTITTMYQRVLKIINPKHLIGLTATPVRTDKINILSVFDNNILHNYGLIKAVENGYLVPHIYNIRMETNISLDGITVNRNGEEKEYQCKALEKKILIPQRNELIVNTYVDFFTNKRKHPQTLVYCVTVQHARELNKLFRKKRIKSEVIVGSTSDKKREEIIQRYNECKINVILSVNVLTEGFDAPNTEVIFMARPTLSSLFYEQCIGRGTRYFKGKKSLIVVDFTDNSIHHHEALHDNSISMNSLFDISHYTPCKPFISHQRELTYVHSNDDSILHMEICKLNKRPKHVGCKIEGCDKKHQSKGFCSKHYLQYNSKKIDIDGKQLKEFTEKEYIGYKGCKIEGCDGKHVSKGFCSIHKYRYIRGIIDIDGNELRELQTAKYKGYKGCKIEGCDKKHRSKGFCNLHFSRYNSGILDIDGNQLKEMKCKYNKNSGCKIKGCDKKHQNKGFCSTHHSRYKRGVIDIDGKKLRELKNKYNKNGDCKIKGCYKKHDAKGFCHKHYYRYRHDMIDIDGNQLKEFTEIKYKGYEGCKIEGCDKKHQSKGFCSKHYQQYNNKKIDIDGKKLREFTEIKYIGYKSCKIENCDEKHSGKGFCSKHNYRYLQGYIDIDGKKLREFTEIKYKGYEGCKIEGCDGKHRSMGFCTKHYGRYNSGILNIDGNELRKIRWVGKYNKNGGCKIEGCDKKHRANGFCKLHQSRYRTGILDINGNQLRKSTPKPKRR